MTKVAQLKNAFEELGIHPKKSLGQNFLISEAVVEKILKAAAQNPFEQIIEIGPGLGALTVGLVELSSRQGLDPERLTLIELDRRLSEYWARKGLQVLNQDAMGVPWNEFVNGKATLLVSNLPYQISSSLVIDRSLGPENLNTMVLMFQKEVAERICAKPKTANFGMLSVVAQATWTIDVVAEAGSRDFYPPPKVSSRVLKFQRKCILSEPFLKFVKAAFAQRRKLLIKNLMSYFSSRNLDAQAIMNEIGVSHTARAEELKVEDFARLFLKLTGEAHGH